VRNSRISSPRNIAKSRTWETCGLVDFGCAYLWDDRWHWSLCWRRSSGHISEHTQGQIALPKRFRQRCQIASKTLTGQRSQQTLRQPKKWYFFCYAGVNDIKNHRYLNTINFGNLTSKKISPPYRPVVKSASDTSNFSSYAESNGEGAEIKANDDPFLRWDWLSTKYICSSMIDIKIHTGNIFKWNCFYFIIDLCFKIDLKIRR